jgi:ribosomal protein S18 acetylase RimI-like enzyme
MIDLQIRKATEEDIPNIESGIRASWDIHAGAEPELFDLEKIHTSNVQKYYKEALSNSDSVILVAKFEGEFAGFIKADTEIIPHWFKHNKTFWIDDIYINEKFRRKGIARKLIDHVEAAARKRGIKRIQARIYKFNKSMQNLLISLGYDFPHMTANKVLE